MKKRVLLIILAVVMLCCTACGTDGSELVTTEPETVDPEVQRITDELYAILTVGYSVDVTMGDTKPSISVTAASWTSITDFGTRIYNSIEACKQVMGDQDFSLDVMWYKDGDALIFYYVGSENFYGSLADNRSGEIKVTELKSLADLEKKFPKLTQDIKAVGD